MEGSFEVLDRECSALGGLFQLVVNDMKAGVPYYEEFASRAAKLHSQLKNTILSLGAFLDAFQKIADAATNARGGTRDIGACLTRIVIRHKAMESRLKTLCSALLDCMILPLQDKIEDWKKTGSILDKEHAKDYKKNRAEFKKKTENYARLQKKHKKNPSKQAPHLNGSGSSGSSGPQNILDNSLMEVNKQMKILEETEKNAVRKVLTEERSRYCTFVACLKPLIDEEVFMVSEFQQLEEISRKVSNATEDPFKLPPSSEQVITDIISTKNGEPKFHFTTPPSSPSSLGSRKSSMCSISSAGSSVGSPSHQTPAGSKNMIRHRSLSQHNPSSALGPMRLSSISSQDSGFTSQDTLFIRPHSPNGRSKVQENSNNGSGGLRGGVPGVPPPVDRPHTISSAYEKGHQRPQLQAYTFAPPPAMMNEILEESPSAEESNVYGQLPPPKQGGFGGTLLRRFGGQQEKPPVPQRCVSLERPSMPGGGKPLVPVFHANKEDMVLPQPVYMNMNDLAHMRKQGGEEEYDLKTPTTEELSGVPDTKSGDGGSSSNSESSSGYGSQSTVRLEDQQQQQHSEGSSLLQGSGGNATLRRSHSAHHSRPPPPARLSSTRISTTPPPPAPLSHIEESSQHPNPGSNSSTPTGCGSMEYLPPPPPHLLQSDDELDEEGTHKRSSPPDIIAQRSLSVADSVRALQNINHKPASPKNLRRSHSVTDPRNNKQQRIPEQQIYAPVTHLQQKMSANRGGAPHSGGPHPGQDQTYGFGIQFYQHQNSYMQLQAVGGPAAPLPPPPSSGYDQIMKDVDEKMASRPLPPPMPLRQAAAFAPGSYEEQTSDRVRRWIESRSVSNVKDCRPYLNAEIKQGFALRKTSQTNDRSAPRL